MKRCGLILLLLIAGCFRPGEQKILPDNAPEAPGTKTARPVTADMVTPETAHKIVDQLGKDIEREIGKE